MSTTPKPTSQELYANVTDFINRVDAQAVFLNGVPAFPGKFHVYEPERGELMVLEELPNQMVRIVKPEAVTAAIASWGAQLSPEYFNYKFDKDKAAKCKDYWLYTTAKFPHVIKPVLQLSTPGWTWQRLDFDMKDAPTPLFDAFLDHMETNRAAFLAFMGALFDEAAPRQFYLWLYGQGNDGKGTWSRMLRRFFAASYVALSDDPRMHNQFFNARCVGKRVGMFPDCENTDFVRSGMFMSLSGGDPVSIEYKGRDAYTAELTTMFIALSNKLPNISSSRAHMRRAIICKMKERELYEAVPDYEENLWAERAGIIHKCWHAWLEMKKLNKTIVVDQHVLEDLAEDNEQLFEHIFTKLFEVADGVETPNAEIFAAIQDNTEFSNRTIKELYEWMARKKKVVRKRAWTDGLRKNMLVGIKTRKSDVQF